MISASYDTFTLIGGASTAPLRVWSGAALKLSNRSVGLPTQEGRDVELVFFRRIMHSRRPSERVETLRGGPTGIFRYWLARSAFRMAGRWPRQWTLELRHRPRGAGGRRRRRLFRTAAETDIGQPLHQRQTAVFGMILGRELAALRLDLILRRHWQFVDARHALRAV